MSIRIKLLGAFLVAVVAAAALAAVALTATWSLADLAQRLYDQPLQAVSHARSAETAFAILQRAGPDDEREALLLVLRMDRKRGERHQTDDQSPQNARHSGRPFSSRELA